VTGDPFVVQVPAGATEIDLRPALVPIVRKLMLAFSDEKAHSKDDVAEWLADVYRDDRRAQLIESLDWTWIKSYMLATDWRRSCGSGGYHQYYPPKGKRYRYKPYVCVILKEQFNSGENFVEMGRAAVKRIAKWEGRAFEAVCAAILAHVSVIDALAALAPDDGSDDSSCG